jgi:hypothetical protein
VEESQDSSFFEIPNFSVCTEKDWADGSPESDCITMGAGGSSSTGGAAATAAGQLTEAERMDHMKRMAQYGLNIKILAKRDGEAWTVAKSEMKEVKEMEAELKKLDGWVKLEGWRGKELMASTMLKWSGTQQPEPKKGKGEYPIYTPAEVESLLRYEAWWRDNGPRSVNSQILLSQKASDPGLSCCPVENAMTASENQFACQEAVEPGMGPGVGDSFMNGAVEPAACFLAVEPHACLLSGESMSEEAVVPMSEFVGPVEAKEAVAPIKFSMPAAQEPMVVTGAVEPVESFSVGAGEPGSGRPSQCQWMGEPGPQGPGMLAAVEPSLPVFMSDEGPVSPSMAWVAVEPKTCLGMEALGKPLSVFAPPVVVGARGGALEKIASMRQGNPTPQTLRKEWEGHLEGDSQSESQESVWGDGESPRTGSMGQGWWDEEEDQAWCLGGTIKGTGRGRPVNYAENWEENSLDDQPPWGRTWFEEKNSARDVQAPPGGSGRRTLGGPGSIGCVP